MNDFFRLDGPIFRYGTLIADLLFLSLIFTFCSIPIITLGASLTGLFYVTTRQVSRREGYVTRDFLKSFRQNFIKSTVFYLFFLICGIILTFNFVAYNYVARSNQIVLVFQVVLSAEIVGVMVYLFPLIARFDLKMSQYLKNAFYFANRHISTTVTCLVALGAAFWLFMKIPFLIIILPGAYAYFASIMIMRVFRKYLPDMDRDVEEEVKFDIITDLGEDAVNENTVNKDEN